MPQVSSAGGRLNVGAESTHPWTDRRPRGCNTGTPMGFLLSPPTTDPSSDSAVLSDGALSGSDWLNAGSIMVGTLIVAVIAVRVVRRIISHGIGHGFAAILTSRLIGYAIFLVGLFYALTSLGVRVGPLLGALGLGGLVLALALQPVVGSFIASVILQSRRPFAIGDTVEVDGQTGIVVDIDSRVTLLRGLDGTQIRVPNANVTAATIINLTREPVRRSSLTVGVAYDTNLQLATEVIRDALSRVPRVLTDPSPSMNLSAFGESSIDFTVLYWHASDVPSELASRHDLIVAIHQAFADAGITIAFPQVVVWSGAENGSDLYDGRLDEIQTPYPGLDESPSKRPRRVRQWRRSSRRSTKPDATQDS